MGLTFGIFCALFWTAAVTLVVWIIVDLIDAV